MGFRASVTSLAGSTRAQHTHRNLDTDRVLTARRPSRGRTEGRTRCRTPCQVHPGSCSLPRCVPAVREHQGLFRASWSNTFFQNGATRCAGRSLQPTNPHFCIALFHLRHQSPWHPQRTRDGGDWRSVLSNLGKHLRAPGSPLVQAGRTGRRRLTPVPVLGLGGQRGGSRAARSAGGRYKTRSL